MKDCQHKECKGECKHKVDFKSLEKSKAQKKNIIDNKKIVNKK